MNYLHFIRANRGLLSFGLITALTSSFGQTFFISLFVLHFQELSSLGKGGFGVLYSAATLVSALLLPIAGPRLESSDLRRYTGATLAGLALAATIVALASNVWLLGLGLMGLRFLGQGLLGHISYTVMARDFGAQRGKALGIAGLGYPLGEALFPVLCALALHFLPWRGLWLAIAFLLILVVMPGTLRLLPASTGPQSKGEPDTANPTLEKKDLWRDPRFYFILPAVLTPPFVLTGMFLYQAVLAQSKAWPLTLLASAFSAFAIIRALSSIAVGPVIDRYNARRILPFFLLPLAAGLLIAETQHAKVAAFAYMILAGVSAGASGSILSAVWAEMYGPENVARARSLASSLAIFAAAGSPGLMGWMFSRGITLEAMLGGAAVLLILASLAALPVSGLASDGLRLLARLRFRAENCPADGR